MLIKGLGINFPMVIAGSKNILIFYFLLAFLIASISAAQPVDLGTADNFVILSKSGVTNVPTSAIDGNVGTSPITGAAITGLTCSEVDGNIYDNDGFYTGGGGGDTSCLFTDDDLLTIAVNDMEAAYTDATGRTPPVASELGAGILIAGTILTPGIYKWTTPVTITGDITLSGNSSDVWIFQIGDDAGDTLTISSGKKIILSGGAQAKNVFWQVNGQTTLGTNSVFNGIILDKT